MLSMKVNGLDTYEDLGFVMEVDELAPPEPKFYTVDIPAGDGVINLTQALSGDTVYNNRKQTFKFSLATGEDFEGAKTKLMNLLHGREYDYQLSFDPDYTYHGWFSVDSHERSGNLKQITVNVDANPYKTKGLITNWYNITDGAQVGVKSGRKRVRPKFEFTESTIVCWGGKSYTMPSGTYTMDDVVFSEGANFITFIPSSQRKFLTYREASSYEYGEFGEKWRVYEWYRGVEKWMVSQVAFNGTGTQISGDITITATFEDNSTSSTTVSLEHPLKTTDDKFVLNALDGEESYILSTDVKVTGSDGSATYVQSKYGLSGELPYSTSSPVKSVAITYSGGSIVGTYETVSVADTNTHMDAVYSGVTYGEYGFGGTKEMVYASMRNQKISALTTYLVSGTSDTEKDIILEDGSKTTVFVQYEWSDL